MESAKRIEKWDNLKFLLIFLVVLGHFADLYSGNLDVAKKIVFFIYSFHMPLFIFVSGLFSKKNINQKRYDKINLFLVLFLFMSLLQYIFKCIFVKGFDFSLNIANMKGAPWYAFAIFAFSIITINVRRVDPKYVLIFSVALACIAGYDKSINEYFSFSRIIVYYPFFYLGYYLEPDKVNRVLSKREIKVVSAAILFVLLLFSFFLAEKLFWMTTLFTGVNPFYKLKKLKYLGCLLRLVYYPVTAAICASVISLVPNKFPKGIISRFGSRSIQVYALHYPIIYLLSSERLNILFFRQNYTHLMWTVIISSVVLTIVLSLKIFEKPFKIIMNSNSKVYKIIREHIG